MAANTNEQNADTFGADPGATARRPDIKGFTPIPNWVLMHPDLGRVDIAVYACLSHHADAKTGTCWPSAAIIMAETKIASRHTLQNALDRLRRVGAVDVHPRTGYANLYFLPDRAHLDD